jgi:two-component system chemotaxis sensor kinase CheA
MDAMTEIRLTFFEECDEQLVELDRGLLQLSTGTGDGETIGVVYRAVHSIKGGAASFDLHDLSRFAKMFEGVLGEIRAERLVPTEATHALLARARAILGHLVEVARSRDSVFADLRSFVPGAEAETATAEAATDEPTSGEVLDLSEFGFTPVSVDFEDAGPNRFDIVFRPRAELYANANESARLIREVLSLGEGHVVVDASDVPLLGDLDAEGAYLSWTITLTTDRGEGAIREIFDFAEFDCDLDITRLDTEEAVGDDGDSMADLDPDVAALFARLQASA